MLKVGLIVGSTRPNRFADIPMRWLVEGAAARRDLELTVLDLPEFRLPFLNEPASPMATGGVFSEPEAERWRKRIGEFDAFVAIVAEYNHGPTAILKNALDSALNEWQRKPIAFVGYGGVGAARAIETLRGVVIELQMAPIRHEEGALPRHPAEGSFSERVRISCAKPRGHVRSPGAAGRGTESGPPKNQSRLTMERSICALFSS